MFLLFLAFLLSGVAGLSYEVTWTRYLQDIFGASAPALAATIAVYFAGLALGSWLGSRVFGRSHTPIRDYALLEASIGATAALVPGFLSMLAELCRGHAAAGSLLWDLPVAIAALLVPTTLLGATFPAMAAVVRSLPSRTWAVGAFYGLNTLGAVLGCLLVAFLWLPWLGRAATSALQVGINLAIALMLLVMHAVQRRGSAPVLGADPVDEPSVPEAALPDGAAEATLPSWLALGLAGGSGLFAISVEVLWIRALALSFPATVYVLALVLAAFLVGLGSGALLVGQLHRRRAPRLRTLWALFVLVPFGCLLTQHLLPWLLPLCLRQFYSGTIGSFEAYVAWVGGAAVLVMLPATLAMGAILPVLVGMQRMGDLARSGGLLYAVNTLCGVVGSLLCAFVVMPWLGVSSSLVACCVGYLLMASVVALSEEKPSPGLRLITAVSLVAVLLLAGFRLHPEVNPLKDQAGMKLLFYQDAASSTVSIYEDRLGQRSLWSNNLHALSETRPSTVGMQYWLGQASMLVHPRPRRALLVGFATGTTLAAMAQDPRLARLDCVELHELYFALAPFFEAVNLKVWQDRRVRLIRADGRHYLSRDGEAYDVIASDLYVPQDPGVAYLYSLEHFDAVRRRLARGGLHVTWLPLWQLSPEEMAVVARTFLAVFPDAKALLCTWFPGRPLLGLVGLADGATALEPRRYVQALRGRLSRLMRRAFPDQPWPEDAWPRGEAGARLLGTAHLRALAGQGPLNRVDHLHIEFSSPRTLLEERLHGTPLWVRNLARLDALARSVPGLSGQ